MSFLTCFKRGVAATAMAVACLGAPTAHAAPVLLINTSGILTGAKGVTVGDLGAYDVSFVSGTCVSVFSGCDGSGDFTFSTIEGARLATEALLREVLLDVDALGKFDSSPGLTLGCSGVDLSWYCSVFTPYELIPASLYDVRSIVLWNGVDERRDVIAGGGTPSTLDFSLDPKWAWAVWSPSQAAPVPEPGTLALLGMAGLALGWTQRRRRIGVTAQ